MTNDQPAATNTRPILTLDEVTARLHCRRTKVFELLRTGRLVRAERLGRDLLITTASVERLELELAGGVPASAAAKRAPPKRARRTTPVSDDFMRSRPHD